jgi:hypothetical protein
MYYVLSETDIKNFSAWVTSSVFVEKAKNLTKEEVYPLEMIWYTPDKLYFILLPINIENDSVYQILMQYQRSLQKELKAILMDWKRFCVTPLLSDLPPDYQFKDRGDTVVFSFKRTEQKDSLDIEVFLNKNGSCLKIISHNPETDQRIMTYPSYIYSGNKWVCAGWLVQIQEGEEITNGYTIKVVNKTVNNVLLPDTFIMQLQTRHEMGQIFRREYGFRNIRVDRDLKILE